MKINTADHEKGYISEEDQIDHAAHSGGLQDILRGRIGKRFRNGVGIDKDQDQRDYAGDPGRIVACQGLRLPDGIAQLFKDRITEIVDDQAFHGAYKSRADDIHAAEIIIGQNARTGRR